MVVHMDEDDTRCPMVAGMEDVSVDEVLRPRDCVLTNKPYPLLSFRDCGYCAFPSSLSEKEMKQQIFHGGRLVCRLLNVLFFKDKSAKAYSGIIRQLYANEADANEDTAPNQGPGASRSDCISVDNDQEEDDYGIMDPDLSGQGKKRSQPDILEGAQKKWPSPMPTKQSQYTFGDVFCGAGGSSQGAVQAGLHVKWGLDFDADALEAYQNNHLGALPFRCNAHNFPPRGNTIEDLRVDILHLSPPCCYFSPAQ
jgi:DNA (cytosine-5)-methyltransferase 1